MRSPLALTERRRSRGAEAREASGPGERGGHLASVSGALVRSEDRPAGTSGREWPRPAGEFGCRPRKVLKRASDVVVRCRFHRLRLAAV